MRNENENIIEVPAEQVSAGPQQATAQQTTAQQTTAIAVRGEQGGALDRPLTLDEVGQQLEFIRQVMRQEMKEGQDYGKVPGCGSKPGLFQPGAQKLCLTFRLTPSVNKEVLRELGNYHREYEFTLALSSATGREWYGVGTCSTLESKYRYRQGERSCPNCKKKTIIKGKAEYGGGWICFSKKGGCGAKWADGAKEIEGQNVEKVEHDNPADFWNTVRKMAFKRALVHATINATNTSELWSQDLEDLPHGSTVDDDAPAVAVADAPEQPHGNGGKKPTDKKARIAKLKEWLGPEKEQWAERYLRKFDVNGNDFAPCLMADGTLDDLSTSKLDYISQNSRSFLEALEKFTRANDDTNSELLPQEVLGSESMPPEEPAAAAEESLPEGQKVYFGKVLCVVTRSGNKKNGEKWTRYGVKSGTEESPVWFSTFSNALGKVAMSLDKKQAKFTYTPEEQGNNLENIEPV